MDNAIARGELSDGTSPTALMDVVFGVTVMHPTGTPTHGCEITLAHAEEYPARLADAILAP